MQYSPNQISDSADIAIARNHSIGGQKKLWASKEPVREVGELFFAGDGSGVWTPDPITQLPSTGADLQLKVREELDVTGSSPAVITVVGTDQNDAALTGTATLSAPGWVLNKGNDFSEGAAYDVVTPAGKRFKTITSVSGTQAKKWSKLALFQLPSDTSWQYIDMVESIDPKIGTRPGHAIPDGLDGSKEVVAARSPVASISISAMHRSVADGLQRFAGRSCSLRWELWKDGKILAERHIAGGCILSVDPSFPDGDGEVKQVAEGMMQEYFGFHAK